MTDSIILKNVSYKYSEESEDFALTGVSLTFKKGEAVAVLGHNGSGKSTLAKLLNALYLPADGSVSTFGYDTADENNTENIRRRIGMVFQNPDNQIVASIVEEDVAFGPENLGLPPDEIRKRVDESLRAVGMYDFRLRQSASLSGGQKQRVAIAGVLAMNCECIILDEATAMLDPLGRREVIDIALRLNREKGITLIMITHDMDEAAEMQRIIVLSKGRMIMDGTPKQVFSRAVELQKASLFPPTMALISGELIRRGADIDIALTQDELADRIEGISK